MEKIFMALCMLLALATTANARNQYSPEQPSLLDNILGTTNSNWSVSPMPHFRGRYRTHMSYNNTRSIVALGHQLQSEGLRVSEHPAFGGVHHVHHGWAHYVGRAIDVNIGRGVREAFIPSARHRFDNLAARARAAGYTVLWKVAGHFDHIHIQR